MFSLCRSSETASAKTRINGRSTQKTTVRYAREDVRAPSARRNSICTLITVLNVRKVGVLERVKELLVRTISLIVNR